MPCESPAETRGFEGRFAKLLRFMYFALPPFHAKSSNYGVWYVFYEHREFTLSFSLALSSLTHFLSLSCVERVCRALHLKRNIHYTSEMSERLDKSSLHMCRMEESKTGEGGRRGGTHMT